MVQQLFNTVENLKAEVRRLRGELNAIATGGKIIPNAITGGVQLPLPIEGAILYGTSIPDWARLPPGSEGEVLTMVSGLPNWEASAAGDPSDTVEDETTFGITPDAGASDEYSRGDHTHGTPDAPSSVVEDLTTAETDDTLRLAPDGVGGVEWVAGGGGGGTGVFYIPFGSGEESYSP